MKLSYLAYGSNMFSLRLAARGVSNPRVLDVICLRGYELRWHKRGRLDGSGKCNLAVNSNAIAYGVILEIDPSEKAALDRAEGLGSGYGCHMLSGAYVYLAQPSHIDDSLRPYEWYKQMVLAGARENGLPAAYVRQIESVVAVKGPDGVRDASEAKSSEA